MFLLKVRWFDPKASVNTLFCCSIDQVRLPSVSQLTSFSHVFLRYHILFLQTYNFSQTSGVLLASCRSLKTRARRQHFNDYNILMFGRLMGGIAAARPPLKVMQSAPRSTAKEFFLRKCLNDILNMYFKIILISRWLKSILVQNPAKKGVFKCTS